MHINETIMQLQTDERHLETADHVLLLLAGGILQQPCLGQLERVLSLDESEGSDRITALYSEDHGWQFGCLEHVECKAKGVKRCLDDHEALIYRHSSDQQALRYRHEFPAMLNHLVKQILQRSAMRKARLVEPADEGVPPVEPSTPIHEASPSDRRAELSSLKLSALQERAEAQGVDAEKLEDAYDDDDPEAAVI
eukprot:COSAG04_NODE_10552_length_769_cov_1.185075_1_plen_194_part_10